MFPPKCQPPPPANKKETNTQTNFFFFNQSASYARHQTTPQLSTLQFEDGEFVDAAGEWKPQCKGNLHGTKGAVAFFFCRTPFLGCLQGKPRGQQLAPPFFSPLPPPPKKKLKENKGTRKKTYTYSVSTFLTLVCGQFIVLASPWLKIA